MSSNRILKSSLLSLLGLTLLSTTSCRAAAVYYPLKSASEAVYEILKPQQNPQYTTGAQPLK